MGRKVFWSAIRLDLDDACLPAPGLVVADEPRAEQGRSDDLGRTGQCCPIEDRQAGVPGNQTSTESGTNMPKIERKPGIKVALK